MSKIRANIVKVEGRRVVYEYKLSHGKNYYSFDSGFSWHTTKKAAYEAAKKRDKIWYANPSLKWHRKQEDVALKQYKGAMTKLGGKFYEGKVAAQQDSIRKEWSMKKRKTNPVYNSDQEPVKGIRRRLMTFLDKEARKLKKKDDSLSSSNAEDLMGDIAYHFIRIHWPGTWRKK